MSDSVRPHRHKPPRVPHPWDSPGKNTGVGCHFLLQCMQVKSETEVTQSYPTISNPMDHSLPVSSIHGTFQARVLEWKVIAFSGIELGLVIYFAYGNIHVSMLFSQIIPHSPSPRVKSLFFTSLSLLSLLFNTLSRLVTDFSGGRDGKASAYNAGDPGSIPGLGRSPGEGNGNPL